jgi:hypothetical protein
MRRMDRFSFASAPHLTPFADIASFCEPSWGAHSDHQACGGISSVEGGREKIQAGAALVQIYSSFIYQGPKRVPSRAR